MSDEESDPVTSSSSEEEDEDGKELTLEVEKKFLKTLQSLKTKDPAIYDASVKFFDTPEINETIDADNLKKKSRQSKAKPFLLSDYDKLLVKSGGEIKEESDVLPSYNDEQEAIKSSLKKALLDSDDSDDENSSLLTLKPKIKTIETENSSSADEETDIKHWLTGAKSELKNKNLENELKPLHDIWTNPQLDDGETYLRDYILNKRYLDDASAEAAESNSGSGESDRDSSDDFDAKQEEFEHKYNFRFEEPDQEFIKRYPRTMDTSMRRKESKRKVKREQTKKNREEKLEKKRREMKKLKKEKREEILSHLNNLKSITGNQALAFKEDMLEGDFNPDEHDKIMESMFNEEFYAGKDDEKPVFQDDDDDNYDYPEDGEDEEYTGDTQEDTAEGGYEDQDAEDNENYTANGELITDCDYDPSSSLTSATAGRKLSRAKLKRLKRKEKQRSAAGPRVGAAEKSLFAQAVARAKPVFNPQDEAFMKYVDDYYGLEFEDLIGDLPCRFKYKRVVPNSYGLSIEEILTADDQELNKWCPVKKIYSQRSEHVEKNEVRVYSQRARDENLKRKLLPSLYRPPEEGDDEEDTQKILPSEEERKEMMNKKQKKIQQISEQFEKEKQSNPSDIREEEGKTNVEKEDVIDETIVNEYLKQKKKTAKAKSNKRKLDDSKLNDKTIEKKDEFGVKKKKVEINGSTVDVAENMDREAEEVAKKKKGKGGQPVGRGKTSTNEAKENCDSQLVENGIQSTKQEGDKKKKKRRKRKKKKNAASSEDSKEESTNKKSVVDTQTKKDKKKSKRVDEVNKVVDKKKKGLKKKINDKQAERRNLKTKTGGKGGHAAAAKNKKDAKVTEFSDSRLKAYGINPKKFKSKLLYGNKDKVS